MNRAHIPGFPNPIPKVDWLTHLPKFKDQDGDDAAFHLIKFHMHISRLKVQFLEDCLMKMFMATLEEKARTWYEKLPHASIYSLQDFYAVFCENYKRNHPSLALVESISANLEDLCQLLAIDVYDEDVMDIEIREALTEASAHQKEEAQGDNLDGRPTTGPSPADETNEES